LLVKRTAIGDRAGWLSADVDLTDVRVPAENRLPGARSSADTTRVLAATRERRQFGRPLASFQIIQQQLVSIWPT
jgi:glutaryl-CoA dehydrogenase